jgi:hypothetical protein
LGTIENDRTAKLTPPGNLDPYSLANDRYTSSVYIRGIDPAISKKENMKRGAVRLVWTAAVFLGVALDASAQGHLVTTLSGAGPDQAPALAFGLGPVRSVALDNGGNLYIGSYNYSWIFKVDRAGTLTMAAGNGGYGFGGDGGPATEATIVQAADVAVDISGNLFFADSVRVRRVDALTGIIRPSPEGPIASEVTAVRPRSRIEQPLGSRSMSAATCSSPTARTIGFAR